MKIHDKLLICDHAGLCSNSECLGNKPEVSSFWVGFLRGFNCHDMDKAYIKPILFESFKITLPKDLFEL